MPVVKRRLKQVAFYVVVLILAMFGLTVGRALLHHEPPIPNCCPC